MSISGQLGKIVDSKAAGIAVFTISGAGKLVSDYTNAPDDKKQYTLLRDTLILGGSALGVAAYEGGIKRFLKSDYFKKKRQNVTSSVKQKLQNTNVYKNTLSPIVEKYGNTIRSGYGHAKEVINNCLDNATMLAFGIGGSIVADYAIRYSHLEKNNKLKKLTTPNEKKIGNLYDVENKLVNRFQNSSLNKNLGETVGDEVKSNIYSRITDMPIMRMFSKTMVGMQGFEVIEEKTFRERLKHSRKCLISNSLVPLFFLSISTSLTKKLKGIVRIPIIFTSLVAGTMYTNKMIDKIGTPDKKKEKPKDNNADLQKKSEPKAEKNVSVGENTL